MKKLLSALLAAALILSLSACGKEKEEPAATEKPKEDGISVGVVLPTKDEARWERDGETFADILGDGDYEFEILYSRGSSAAELTNVESLIEKGMEALIICPQDTAAAAAAAQKAHDAGAAVICCERLITDSLSVDYYVTFTEFGVGAAQGQYLIDAYAGRTGVPLYLFGLDENDEAAAERFSGAWSVLSKAVAEGQFTLANCPETAEYSGKTLDAEEDGAALSAILDGIAADWELAVSGTKAETELSAAARMVSEQLSANDAALKGEVAVLAPSDAAARVISDVFHADTDVTGAVITGEGAEADSLSYILKGLQSMTVWRDTASLVSAVCDIAGAVLEGEKPETDAVYDNSAVEVPAREVAPIAVTVDNVSAVVDSGFADAEDIEDYPG